MNETSARIGFRVVCRRHVLRGRLGAQRARAAFEVVLRIDDAVRGKLVAGQIDSVSALEVQKGVPDPRGLLPAVVLALQEVIEEPAQIFPVRIVVVVGPLLTVVNAQPFFVRAHPAPSRNVPAVCNEFE